ncbi:2OG-Fe(II) oxygenase family protein [Novosphingobium naphthalenivorans]|uniref:2OG-Fe(II) oxygenase family protein n=1 Tax=Novosphingobium naphthalenivorans TaxID=273168 RepID=UPI0008333683|nr:2OG-Fe(II) oxygenase family protein [Novosphingobium naphthalenivorans]
MHQSPEAFQLAAVSYRSPDAPARFVEALRETGFGVLVDHPIPVDLVEDVYAEWLAFFDSPAKHRYPRDPERQDGYFSHAVSETAKGHSKRDLKEYFHIFPWGRYPGEVSGAARRYRDLAAVVAGELLGWIEDQTPADVRARFSMPLGAMIADSPSSLLRVLRYPPLTGGEEHGAVRAAAHEDINLITLLPASNQSGLQLLAGDGNWMDVPCDFGALVVNVGDMLQEASGGYFRSTTHRVVNPSGEAARMSRISLPLFLQPRPEVVLSERYTAGSYLAERLRELSGRGKEG